MSRRLRGPWPSRPTSSTPCATSTSPRSHRRSCCTYTSTKPLSAVETESPGSRGSDRSRSPGSPSSCAARHQGPARQGPLRPGPLHRLRAPRVATRPGPPRHRRRLLAVGHLDQPSRRPRPPHPLRPRRRRARTPAGSDRPPQLRPPWPTTPPLEDPRGLQVTPMRRRTLHLAHPTRPRLPHRPHRHPPCAPREGTDDPRRADGRRHLPGVVRKGPLRGKVGENDAIAQALTLRVRRRLFERVRRLGRPRVVPWATRRSGRGARGACMWRRQVGARCRSRARGRGW